MSPWLMTLRVDIDVVKGGQSLGRGGGAPPLNGLAERAEVVPFRAETRTSGVFIDGVRYFKGAVESVK